MKLNPPAASADQVLRHAVHELIRHSPARLVLMRGPAGFGKTTAMLQYRALLAEQGTATAWLTVDSADNDSTRFVQCLGAAVDEITMDFTPRRGAAAQQDAHRLFGDPAMTLVERLAQKTEPFTLFLDDYEAIQQPGVHGLVREILNHLPRGSRLVIGSRSLPELGLGRLRARRDLLEIDASRLRFSAAESTEFLSRRRQLPLAAADLAALHSKTEGWAAALWLASVALESHPRPGEFIRRFSGTDGSLSDYLAEDVLSGLPPDVRDFVLRTSILRTLNVPLCNALLPQAESGTIAAILRRLEAGNVFLVPIEGDERGWRYHSLFSEFLRAQFAAQAPDEVPRLHRAASVWFESEQRVVPAVDHALEAGDFERALGLMQQHATQWLAQGRMRLLSRWFGMLPASALAGHPELQAVQVWALCFTRGAWEAYEHLQRLDLDGSPDPAVRAHAGALRPQLLSMMDRWDEAYEAGTRSLALRPPAPPFVNSVLDAAMASACTVQGRYLEARKLLDNSRSPGGEGPSAFSVMYAETVEGSIDLMEGRLRQATARLRIAVRASPAVSFGHMNGNPWCGVLHAAMVYESNDLAQASHLLQLYAPVAREVGIPDLMILGDVMLVRIAFHHGEVDEAFQMLTEMEYRGHQRRLPRVIASAMLERARLQLTQGHGQAARDELGRAQDVVDWPLVTRQRRIANDLDYLDLARLRLAVLTGDARATLASLEQELATAVAASRHRRALKLRLLQAIALHRSGQMAALAETMGAVLKDACAEGFERLILDEGAAVRDALQACSAYARDARSPRLDPILTEYRQRLLDALGPAWSEADSGEGGDDPALPAHFETLTPREVGVLQLLAEGYSNRAMAEKLLMSESTLRSHLRNINSKLDVHSRTRAVTVGRRLGLIS
ncbi:MAG: LuxR C-terminal-related transcriptional regulator [Burkholderiales bacterium]